MNGMAIEYWGSGFSFIANHEFFYLMAIWLLSGVMGLKWIMSGSIFESAVHFAIGF